MPKKPQVTLTKWSAAGLLLVAFGGVVLGSALGHHVIGPGLGLGKRRCQEGHFASLEAVATI